MLEKCWGIHGLHGGWGAPAPLHPLASPLASATILHACTYSGVLASAHFKQQGLDTTSKGKLHSHLSIITKTGRKTRGSLVARLGSLKNINEPSQGFSSVCY